MISDMELTGQQREIITRHVSSGTPFLEKKALTKLGFSRGGTLSFHSQHALVAESVAPDFKYSVTASYSVSVPKELVSGRVYQTNELARVWLQISGELVPVTFYPIPNLFYIRNLYAENRLSDIIHVDDDQRGMLPPCPIDVSFSMGVIWGQKLTSSLPINHPRAESIIWEFLSAADRLFGNYMKLSQNPPRSPDRDNYYDEMEKLEKGMMHDLENVMRWWKMDVRKSY